MAPGSPHFSSSSPPRASLPPSHQGSRASLISQEDASRGRIGWGWEVGNTWWPGMPRDASLEGEDWQGRKVTLQWGCT